ncbi:multiple inositol polyphosphate phosphatase 1-like [Mya arenaria]|uniref:multiple inositol polyphosphate phosphatase 1-like n=1 Tax=Mya arenaria TaxID=6604 RepID=UPI0022DF015B|nr:multiple inositol polyphosphate phosphatase 1-like [Mya arenaria]
MINHWYKALLLFIVFLCHRYSCTVGSRFINLNKMAASMKINIRLQLILIIFLKIHYNLASIRKDLFSTKTAYAWTRDEDEIVPENRFMTTDFEGKQCTAVNFQVLLRHGARFPGYKDIRRMNQLHELLKFAVRSEDFQFLQTWESEFPEVHEKQLVDEGEDEQFGLGERFGTSFKQLLTDNMQNVQFYSSSKQRCLDSAMAFYEGITGAILDESFDDLKPVVNNDILRFHADCANYYHSVENNKTHLLFYKKFKYGPELKMVATNVAKRLGLKHAELNAGDLKLIYFWCTFEMIIIGKDDWCHLMTDEEKEVMEYHNDLKQYWKKAYGHHMIGKMACPLVSHMFKLLEEATKTRTSVGSFYFGHAETVAPIYAALGLFNDSQPLTDSNFSAMKHRAFKSSKILQFSANLAIVLYECKDYTESGSFIDDFVIRMFVNEQPVNVPACDRLVCPFVKVKDSYLHHIDDCLSSNICKLPVHDEL